MLKNYITIAVRNIIKSPFYALLNILALAVGLTAFIFIYVYVQDEMTFDKYHEKHQRIYRLESDYNIGQKHDRFAIVPIPMAPALKLEYPEIEAFVRFRPTDNLLIRIGEKEFYEDHFSFADSTVFDVFTHKCIAGKLDQALVEPNTAVLTKRIADKYYNGENAVGKVFETGGGRQYKVTAVIEDLPGNSHNKFDALLSASTLAKEVGEDEFNNMDPDRFWNIGVYAYVLINENSSIETVHEKFPGFYEKYMKSLGDKINASFNLMTTPLAEVHLTSKLSADMPTGNIAYVYIFSIVAVFILLLAAINYMNMATARSAERSREVGMRKVMGAEKGQLVLQFLSESVILTLIALFLAYFTVVVFFPNLVDLTGKELSLDLIFSPKLILFFLIISLVIGLVAGSYPAFFLSSFQPLKVLKGMVASSGKSNLLLRRLLVIFQFSVAIVILISTLVVSDQLHFMKNKDLGFKKENVVVLEMQDSAFRSKVEPFKESLLQNPAIENVTNSTGVPGDISWIQVLLVEQESEMKEIAVILAQCDYDYVSTMGFELLQGRDFNKEMGTDDSAAVIINEAAMKQFGWTDNPIGKKITYGFDLDLLGGRQMKVIGVVKDFHYRSLHNNIEPMIMFISQQPRQFVSVRIAKGQEEQALAQIEKDWQEYNNKMPFDYNLLTDIQDEMYRGEEKITKIFTLISAVTVFIALLGLFGLYSFTTEQRRREIGIRKINGATLGDIMILLYKEFFWLMLIAFALGVPVAWWRISIWLESSFTYTTEIHLSSILLAGSLALVVGLVTISFHVIRAALSNPVEAIKYE